MKQHAIERLMGQKRIKKKIPGDKRKQKYNIHSFVGSSSKKEVHEDKRLPQETGKIPGK